MLRHLFRRRTRSTSQQRAPRPARRPSALPTSRSSPRCGAGTRDPRGQHPPEAHTQAPGFPGSRGVGPASGWGSGNRSRERGLRRTGIRDFGKWPLRPVGRWFVRAARAARLRWLVRAAARRGLERCPGGSRASRAWKADWHSTSWEAAFVRALAMVLPSVRQHACYRADLRS